MKRGYLEDDSSLIEACVNRDLAAWSAFIKKYSNLISVSIENRLKKYSIKLLQQDIEDIRQNVLTSLWKDKKLESIKDYRSISYWLAIVAGNMAIEFIRATRALEPPKLVSLFDKIGEDELVEFIPAGAIGPKDELLRNDLSRKIDEAIESLPAKESLVIKLSILHDKKYDEIADILNLPKGTVSSYVKRAKEKLREALKNFK